MDLCAGQRRKEEDELRRPCAPEILGKIVSSSACSASLRFNCDVRVQFVFPIG